MKITTIASLMFNHPMRTAGAYQSAILITTESGKQGRGLFVYEFDKRDVMAETLMVEPHIADEVKAEIDEGDMGVSHYDNIFTQETTGDLNEIARTSDVATTTVYEMC